MKQEVLQGAEKYTKAHQRKKRWYRVVTGLACVVVFCTVYALILPAITMEKGACEIPEHTHSEACYTQVTSVTRTEPVCTIESLNIHQHDDTCYDSEGKLTCGYADFVVHQHDSACYDKNGNLWCPLPEIETHKHSESCYAVPEASAEVHTHTDDCYTVERGELICTESTEPAHEHSDDCYTETSALVCEEDHEHTEDCYETTRELTCSYTEEAAHEHTDGCYEQIKTLICDLPTEPVEEAETAEPELICDKTEAILHKHASECFDDDGNLICGKIQVLEHQHTDACFETVEEPVDTEALTCTLPEDENHTHGPRCYGTWELTCGMEEHTHSEACTPTEPGQEPETEPVNICGMEAHTHSEACYDDTGELICTLEEHQHSEACLQAEADPVYLCGKDAHIHSDACYDDTGELICSLEEHTHNDACLQPVAEPVYVCGMEAHTHSEACYDDTDELICGLEEHQHSDACLAAELTEEERNQVDEVIALIDILPTSGEVEETLAAYEEAGDEEGYEAYFTEVSGQVQAAYVRFEELGPELQAFVPNRNKLLDLEWLLLLEETFSLSAQTESGIEVTVSGPLESLPYAAEKITLTADEISSDTAEMIRNQALEEEGLTAEKNYLFDVTLWYDGQPVEPLGPVTLTFSGLPLAGADEFKVYHIDEEAEKATDINAVLDDEDNVVLDTEHFSTYSVSLLTAATGSYTMTATHTQAETMYADSDASEYLLLAHEGGKYYALGGDGNTYEVTIASDNTVQYIGTADQINNLCWTMSEKETDSNNAAHRIMYIRNVKTGSYLYPNGSSLLTGTDTKVNLWIQEYDAMAATIYPSEGWPKIAFGSSHTFHTYSESNPESEAWFYFAKVDSLPYCHVWLDGTDGGIMSLGGAGDTCQEVEWNTTFTLPTTFTAPEKYSYRLKGWYDVNSAQYYAPGTTVTITRDTVFYADWGPATYDIGQSNGNTVQSLNTNAFITTRVFDYGALFNVQSINAETDVNSAEHTETWSLVQNSAYNGSSLGFVFRDWDTYFKSISYPVGSETWTGEVKQLSPNDNNPDIYSGLYNSGLVDLLFNPSRSVIGKTYVGIGNYLYQYDDETGYYYYDSKLNAASYNQSASRFYIYNYLERTSDSPKDSTSAEKGRDSDFLPFNFPNVNTNEKTVQTYTAENGKSGYQYDAKYDSTEGGVTCSPNNAGTNYWFGLSSSIQFYLPDNSASGGSGKLNQSTKGTDMIFKFSGDDDVWVLVDGSLVLDIGGLHGVEEGTINFSTGAVWRSIGEGETTTKDFSAGEHTLTIYYLERGGSQSNCAIYFNIAPRDYTLELTKTDRDNPDSKLPGAEFTVYTDPECTKAAESLRDSNGTTIANGTFVSDEKGQIYCCGLQPNSIYYIKETKAPPGYNGNENVVLKLSIAGIEQSYAITSELYVDGKLVAIDDPGNIYLKKDTSNVGEERTMAYVFSNQAGCELPNTGGAGTVPYTTGGFLLLTGAALLLLYHHTKRRKEEIRIES